MRNAHADAPTISKRDACAVRTLRRLHQHVPCSEHWGNLIGFAKKLKVRSRRKVRNAHAHVPTIPTRAACALRMRTSALLTQKKKPLMRAKEPRSLKNSQPGGDCLPMIGKYLQIQSDPKPDHLICS